MNTPHRRRRAPALIAALLLQPVLCVLPAQSFELVSPEAERTVSLVVGTGQLIKVEREFTSLFVANPEVADVEVKSPRLLYLTGVGVGETTLFATNDNDDVLMSALVRVTHNTASLQDGISRVAPGQTVTATTVDRSLVLTGSVESQQQADDIVQVATQFVDDATSIVNRIHVPTGTTDLEKVRVAVRSVSQGVTIEKAGDSLVLNGTIETPEQAAAVVQVAGQFVKDATQLVNRMKVAAPTQVNLQVRIAEVNRSVDRQLGIRWGALSVSSGSGDTQIGLIGGGNANASAGWGVGIRHTTPKLNVDVLLQALSDEGLVTVLAEPNLTARSGETANFLAGGEYPYTTYNENSGTTVQFKDYGVGLNFTPTVIDGERISLRVATQVSDLSFLENSQIPSLISRRAETTVDLTSGQSFAIAGLMQNSSAQNAARMPGIGKLPIIGALFSSNGFKRGQTELVIIVTPIIVQPTTARNVRTPVDGLVPPNDFERIIENRFQGDPRKVNRVQNRLGQRRLYGSSGFVFE